jgi:hypothetical protein
MAVFNEGVEKKASPSDSRHAGRIVDKQRTLHW